ncbi:hypothetical protein BVRB_5g100270 [Beta vulgaris subsp. vulgaris]|nr:hypothetical protein BVRB_5g100270 [Beta vulgaris subsp. vulgaris]
MIPNKLSSEILSSSTHFSVTYLKPLSLSLLHLSF